MGRQSIKPNKSIYQRLREESGFTREAASDRMVGVTPSRIEKIENGQEPTPYDVVEMSKCYRRPDLCNYYCTQKCDIGSRYVPKVELTDLPNIILETIASLNDISPMTNRLIEIARDGRITDNEINDFAYIQKKLDKLSAASACLNMWVDRMIYDNSIDCDKLQKARDNIS